MKNHESRTEQQARDKMKVFNKQRTGLSIVFFISIGLLIFLPATEAETLPVRLSVFCSVVLLLCNAAFVLPLRELLLLPVTATGIPAVLLGLGQIHLKLFLIVLLANAGTAFASGITGKATIRSLMSEIEKINRLEREATTDALTHLLNRNGLERAAGAAWALCKRDKKKVGVILADIDYFKNYNDTLGHPEGDHILEQVAESIRSCFRRETDLVGRIGGDEFLIFLPDMNDACILEMARFLSASIINLKVKTDPENRSGNFLSVSIGVATSAPQPDAVLADLYKSVDEALYRAKNAGRNCISFDDKMVQVGGPAARSFSVGACAADAVGGNAET